MGKYARARPPVAEIRRIQRRPPRSARFRRAATAIALMMAVAVGVSAYAFYQYTDLSTGIHRSVIRLPAAGRDTPSGPVQDSSETNILVMGLDSRRDENGKALPAAIYSALRAGNQSDGGYNTNVLMLIHIPANGGKAVGISIPRDDYVDLVGHPDGVSKSKIKEAYGLALDQELRHLVNTSTLSYADAYQQARAAARQSEISTVSAFLGGVPINHFIEVTMAAFYQVAVAVQPISVCLAQATADVYSGADFPAGVQNLSAGQAVSFVRQRRDTTHSGLVFTDLDRERRQQAFIVSLGVKLKQANTFTNFGILQSIIDTAKENIALDSGFDLLRFASQTAKLSSGNMIFVTLPITGYSVIDHKDVNLVDLPQIRSQVQQLLTGLPTAPPVTPSAAPAAPAQKPSTPKTSPAPSPDPNESTTPLTSGTVPCVK